MKNGPYEPTKTETIRKLEDCLFQAGPRLDQIKESALRANQSSSNDFENIIVEFDLTSSVGRLIFDTTANGAGVEVFQPFEVREGEVRLLAENKVNDGERMLSVGIKKLSPDTSVSFTLDVDDTLPKSELGNIRVSGSEISNGQVSVSYGDEPVSSALFSTQSVAIVPAPMCGTK